MANPPTIPGVTDDERLRATGFRIHARPRDSGPLWTRDGHVYGQAEALRIAARIEQERRAKKA